MDYESILGRIRAAVRRGSYLVPSEHVPPTQRVALREIAALVSASDADPDAIRRRIHQLHATGRIDRVMQLSALGVLAASPHVRDYAEAARLAGQQELAALDEGGPWRDGYLASAHRHRGVIAWSVGQYEVALDWFTRALERERSAENVGNVLATLIRLDELDEARGIVVQMRSVLPEASQRELDVRIASDEDLVRLR